jgi:parallel beta-helix repeat protein
MRRGAPAISGGANIEMGGGNSDQLIEFVRSHDPRGWSCLHIAEGPFTCNGAIVQNNDIGPCGSDAFQQWADGISVSCLNATVRNNMIQDPTDGGIVVFGSPGTQVYNNTIWVLNSTLLGGINMVDYLPWSGNFTGTVVHDNTILGGYATSSQEEDGKGINYGDAIIKIGIAVGPKTWFGDEYGNNDSINGLVENNRFSGAFSYGIAVSSANNFTIQGNVMFGNTSFIGARGPNCSTTDVVPTPGPFIVDLNSTTSSSLQSSFVPIDDGDALTCVLPPNGGDFWPYGLTPSNSSFSNSGSHGSGSAGRSAGITVGVVVGVVGCGIAAWFVRKYVISHREASQLFNSTKKADYTQKI